MSDILLVMASIKTDKVVLDKDFHFEIVKGWFLDIDIQSSPVKYTLTHGKKSMTFHSNVTRDLCLRNYGLRLVKGRRQMVLPPHVLQGFVDHETFLTWYDPALTETLLANQIAEPSHVTIDQ